MTPTLAIKSKHAKAYHEAAAVLGVPPQRVLDYIVGGTAAELADPSHGLLSDFARGGHSALRVSKLPAVRERFIHWSMARGVSRARAERDIDDDGSEEKSMRDRAADLIAIAKEEGIPVAHAACAIVGIPKSKMGAVARTKLTLPRDVLEALDAFALQNGVDRNDAIAAVVGLRLADYKRADAAKAAKAA